MSGAAKASASPKARARWPSRATWMSATARLSASRASARVKSAAQNASKPLATEESVSEPPLTSSAATRLRSVTIQGQFESFSRSAGPATATQARFMDGLDRLAMEGTDFP